MECEEISQILLRFLEKFQVRNSRALVQEVGVERAFHENISCGKLDAGLGKNMATLKHYEEAMTM